MSRSKTINLEVEPLEENPNHNEVEKTDNHSSQLEKKIESEKDLSHCYESQPKESSYNLIRDKKMRVP